MLSVCGERIILELRKGRSSQDSRCTRIYCLQPDLAWESTRARQLSGRWHLDPSGGIKAGIINFDRTGGLSLRFWAEKTIWDSKDRRYFGTYKKKKKRTARETNITEPNPQSVCITPAGRFFARITQRRSFPNMINYGKDKTHVGQKSTTRTL